MNKSIIHNIINKKEIKKINKKYLKYDPNYFSDFKIPKITVHGRFQPPLHINHFHTYLANAFQIAEQVTILITNPNLNENNVQEASHRNSTENNPFTYEERMKIFEDFFTNIGIPKSRYTFKPFDITDEDSWAKALNKNIPNLVNTYGEWSEAKLLKFQDKGYKVIHSAISKVKDTSGTKIRKILFSDLNKKEKQKALLETGLMPEAIDAVLKVLNNKKQ